MTFSILFFSDLKHDQNDSFDMMKDQIKKVKSQFESVDSNSLQNEAFGKVATRAYYAYYKAVEIKISHLLILIGTIGTVLLLTGEILYYGPRVSINLKK